MNFQKFEDLFSPARVSRYMLTASNNKRKAQKLYCANLKVAAAFHPLLGLTEIIIRNRINAVLSNHFNDSDWIVNQVSGFMADSSLMRTNRMTGRPEPDHYLKKEVNKAISRFRASNTPITSGKIIAEQTFGFWTELFEPKYYRLIAGRPIQAFTRLPVGYNRRLILNELTTIRQFRNRINHNEPICFDQNNNLDFTAALEVYNSIRNMLTWIDGDLITLVNKLDQVPTTVKKAENILSWWNFF
jgi:hypothetical protein